jgi:hypothetical protein
MMNKYIACYKGRHDDSESEINFGAETDSQAMSYAIVEQERIQSNLVSLNKEVVAYIEIYKFNTGIDKIEVDVDLKGDNNE